MATSSDFVIFIRSSRDLNFALIFSSDDDIASLKRKAEAKHLALFPEDGSILAKDIKITLEGIEYSLPNDITVSSLFEGDDKGKHFLYMDAVPVSSPLSTAPGCLTVLVSDELRCRADLWEGRCSEKAMPNSNYCIRHCRSKSTDERHCRADLWEGCCSEKAMPNSNYCNLHY